MREIDGLLIGAIGSETDDIEGKTCATDESELSMVHEGSSVRTEQGNIVIDFIWVCIARSTEADPGGGFGGCNPPFHIW